MNQELKIDDMNEEAYRQAYRQGFEAGMKYACELKQENERLKRENTVLRGKAEAKNRIDDVDSFYE